MSSPYVTWPDAATAHSKKSIDVVVRVDFILEDELPGPPPDYRRTGLPATIKKVEARWSGHKFKCYDFNVKIDGRIVASRSSVRADALDVVLNESLPGYATTRCEGPNESKSLSDDPNDALVPERGGFWSQSVWDLGENKMSHEIGHVLGLGEGYTGSGTSTTPLPGHPPDVMANPSNPVMPSTITRLVRRHYGPSFEKAMKCPLGVRFGPSRFDLLLAALDDIRLEAKAPRYDPPTADPAARPDPTKFEGTFHAAGEYLTRFPELPWAASGEANRPVKFQLDLGQEPIDLRIDLGFWLLTQKLHWDPASNLPYADGPLVINVKGTSFDSSMMFPGPALIAEFYDPDKQTGPR
jgi:hypothetical protein